MSIELPEFKPRCCQSYMDDHQCKRCPFRKLPPDVMKQAMDEATCNAMQGGIYRYHNIIIPYHKAD